MHYNGGECCWPTNCLTVFDHFLGLALKGFIYEVMMKSLLMK